MAETREIYKTLDLALRVGEMLLSNGAGAPDVSATMGSIVHYLGLRGTSVDVTFTSLTLSYQQSSDEPALFQTRHVTQRDIDYDDLTAVDQLVTSLLLNEITRDEARTQLAQIASSGHRMPRWAITASWGAIGAGVGLLLGGDWVVVIAASMAAAGIEVIQRYLARRRFPFFYQQVAGGLFATLLAIGVAATDVAVDPSLVITACIVMLLAGLGFIGAVQDALTGFYITAGARLLEVMIATAGIIVGVSGGLGLGSVLGVDIALEPGVAGLSHLPVMVLGAAIAASAFAFSAYAPLRVLLPIAVISGGAAAIYFVMLEQGFGRAWASAVAAIMIGVVSYTVAGWARVPPLVIVVSGIVPLLPGLSIYRALALMADGDSNGMLALVTAAAVAISLSSGVILGEYVAQPLKREARRLEQRLSGPRLVGPLRARAVRKTK
ncbi:MAG: threonine/serine exporter family protein [Actinomycetota bacterium]|nr:threonine/serine exporter family protein [Actinomycetota bacterium]